MFNAPFGGAGLGNLNRLLATGQPTQYDSELDDGYYKKGAVKSYTINTTGAQSGTTNVDLPHLVSATGSFAAATQTYTDAGKCSIFKAGGGETIVITGSGSNNGTFTSVSATANTLVVTAGFVDEADAPETTFAKREAISNNTVLDNNTGLMWLRYAESKFGVLGTGLMPWTGEVYDIFAYCAAANTASLGGFSDWRIPNTFELFSLADFNAGDALAVPNTIAFPSFPQTNIWSSTNTPNALNQKFSSIFTSGSTSGASAKTSNLRCILVRGG